MLTGKNRAMRFGLVSLGLAALAGIFFVVVVVYELSAQAPWPEPAGGYLFCFVLLSIFRHPIILCCGVLFAVLGLFGIAMSAFRGRESKQ